MTTETGGPAFPVQGFEYLNDADPADPERIVHTPYPGMTLRDYFAGQELSKMNAVACCDIPDAYARQAEHCYRMADAMLEARTK